MAVHWAITAIRQWAARNKVETVFHPDLRLLGHPIEAHFGPLRTFVIAGSDHQNHVALGRHLHQYLAPRAFAGQELLDDRGTRR